MNVYRINGTFQHMSWQTVRTGFLHAAKATLHKRVCYQASRSYSTLLDNTTSLLRNLHNGAEVHETRPWSKPCSHACASNPDLRACDSTCICVSHFSTCECSMVLWSITLCARQVYLVGTSHVSKASAVEVKQVIQAVRPQTVMVELDADRAQRLISGESWSQEVGYLLQ
jgi:hypothetical protein